ncbi:hypothetical protein P9112_004794 [Eukaryota sp. TZLM1-RC]
MTRYPPSTYAQSFCSSGAPWFSSCLAESSQLQSLNKEIAELKARLSSTSGTDSLFNSSFESAIVPRQKSESSSRSSEHKITGHGVRLVIKLMHAFLDVLVHVCKNVGPQIIAIFKFVQAFSFAKNVHNV